MSREKNNRIVITSVLKPVDDTRMFGKLAVSLDENGYDVHVIGFPSSAKTQNRIQIHSLPYFKRVSWKRLQAPWLVLKKILKLKPSLLIITTHELLFIGLIAKALLKTRLIYDVQENYFLNILHTNSFPATIKPVVAVYVRMKEVMTSPLIDFYFLAEKAYAKELSFIKDKYVILENKLRKPSPKKKREHKNTNERIQLIFTGTLSESTGVFEAIGLAVKLHGIEPRIKLRIIGYCALPETLARLKSSVLQFNFIELIGGDALVPHDTILTQINDADFGIISYPPNKSTETAVPTKLFEYLGMGLPILLINHPLWLDICKPFPAAIPFSESTQPEQLLLAMSNTNFYQTKPENVFWESEEPKLLYVIDNLPR